jgi:DNA/RNA endonuclease YhcR with UshA esterase domain
MAAGVMIAAIVAVPVFAHHAFSSEYDMKKPITVKGMVTKVEWTNPHTWFYVEGKDETGKQQNWGFEGAAPSVLIRRGVPKGTIKVGDMVTIEGFRAKDGSDVASSAYITLPDGKKFRSGVVGGPTDDEVPR